MLKAKVYNNQGKEVKTVDLPKSVFGVQPNIDLINQVLLAQKSNSRLILAHAKARSEVRGGGRKPWRQKGTGRARHGSTRSPIWVGGGVTFGPTKERNFSKRINKKMKKRALFMVLSDRLATGDIKFIDNIEFNEIKTKQAVDLLKKLKFGKKVLVVVEKTDQNIIKSFQNIPKTSVIRSDSLNIKDLLNYNELLITEPSVNGIIKTYVEKESAKDEVKEAKPKVKKKVEEKKEKKSAKGRPTAGGKAASK